MKVLVPGKPVSKTVIGECGSCSAIIQEETALLIKAEDKLKGTKAIGMASCPNCTGSIFMYPLDSSRAKSILLKVNAYEHRNRG